MNKNELVHAIANEAKVTLGEAEKCLNAFTDLVTKTLKKKQSIHYLTLLKKDIVQYEEAGFLRAFRDVGIITTN